jgi:hypothetical protein
MKIQVVLTMDIDDEEFAKIDPNIGSPVEQYGEHLGWEVRLGGEFKWIRSFTVESFEKTEDTIHDWMMKNFTERERGLIENCRTYATHKPSGLPGHQLMLIIDKLHDIVEVGDLLLEAQDKRNE